MRDKKDLISVVVNCFNGSKYLKECIESILSQTYEEFEIIFWDNQSNDESKKIINSYKDPRIKYYYSEKHTNLYEARNLALVNCRGKYLTFLDCDDVWLNNKLQLQIDTFKKNNIKCLATNFFIKNNQINKIAIKKMIPEQSLRNILSNYQICFISLMIDLNFLRENNISFNNNYQLIGDFDFILKILRHEKIYMKNTPTCIYRVHKNNLSNSKIEIKQKEYDLLCKELTNYDYSIKEIRNFKYYMNYELLKYEIICKNYKNAFIKFIFKTNFYFFFKSIIFFLFSIIKGFKILNRNT